MKDRFRREEARVRAESYAPAPKDSRGLYGGIAAVLLLLALVAIGEFYAINVWEQPLIAVTLAALAAACGLILRLRQTRRHNEAHRDEYQHGAPTVAPAPVVPVADIPTSYVTFTRPFLLPAMDAPHRPGTFEVRGTREPIDVMHDAYRMTQRIVLVDGGKTEVLEVAAGELEYALALDESPRQ